MRRKTFDALATSIGLVLAVILLAAGGLLLWGHSFVNSEVSQPALGPEDRLPGQREPGHQGS